MATSRENGPHYHIECWQGKDVGRTAGRVDRRALLGTDLQGNVAIGLRTVHESRASRMSSSLPPDRELVLEHRPIVGTSVARRIDAESFAGACLQTGRPAIVGCSAELSMPPLKLGPTRIQERAPDPAQKKRRDEDDCCQPHTAYNNAAEGPRREPRRADDHHGPGHLWSRMV